MAEQLKGEGAAMSGGNRAFFDLIGGRATFQRAGVECID